LRLVGALISILLESISLKAAKLLLALASLLLDTSLKPQKQALRVLYITLPLSPANF
jgi:hypothetical protein